MYIILPYVLYNYCIVQISGSCRIQKQRIVKENGDTKWYCTVYLKDIKSVNRDREKCNIVTNWYCTLKR